MTNTADVERIARPAPADYGPFYAGYISEVAGEDPVAAMASQLSTTGAMLATVDAQSAGHRYAPGKWSIGEVVGHLADTERIMAYRALALARGETAHLPGFDENAYVATAGFEGRTLESLVHEWQSVRRSTIALFSGFGPGAIAGSGAVNGGPMSVRALAYIIPGHEAHHVRVLRERYGVGRP